VARFSAVRHRVIRTQELEALGISRSAISRWAKRGRLRRRHRGVYVYGGGELTSEGEFLAAVLAIGDDAVLDGRAAGALWDFWSRSWRPVEVMVPRDLRCRPGIRVHSVSEIPPHAVTVRHGIPVTTPEWTVLDLAAYLRQQRPFRRMVHEALAQERVTERSLLNEIERSPGHPGANRVLAELADGAKPTRSGKEDDLVELLRRHNAPPFKTCAHVPGTPRWVEADVMFIDQRLVIEYDGGPWHDSPFRKELDAYKRGLIKDVGFEVLELADGDVEPAAEPETKRRIWELLEL
jgi:very-short-patch-repair endonuclease